MNPANSIAEITLKVPVKKHAMHPTRPDLVAGVSVFDMLFIGQKWYSLDEICWIEPNTAYYRFVSIYFTPDSGVKYMKNGLKSSVKEF